ncbi:MAG: hypothetical protein QM840_04215 [Verrucomicrobiota bacterium]|nr:hypothetical protein [Verrucomicrobiota bacterium]
MMYPSPIWIRTWSVLAAGLLVIEMSGLARAALSAPVSRPIRAVLREPLPPEELSLTEEAAEVVVAGPTFTYRVQKATGLVSAVRVVREGREVIASSGPAELQLDQYRFASEFNTGKLVVERAGKDQAVLRVEGTLRDPAQRGPEVDYTLRHTFFNDGVVVSAVKLTPRGELRVERELVYRLSARGQLSHYLHKTRGENGSDAVRGSLPPAGQAVRFTAETSCLQVFSPAAALAIFTDGGALHLSQPKLDTAVVETAGPADGPGRISLAQYLIRIAPGDPPRVLKAGEPLTFRVGLSVAPNRRPHPRMHDLRMFTWIGDEKHPYPTDAEISRVAQFGFTLFQMHRVGTPGLPRPPADEFMRVLDKVHELGLLFLWEENADLMYDSAPGVRELKAKGQFALWQGFNYGGRYTAEMDSYCDLIATCLASPNGLAEYRLANLARMMDRYAVDGIYLDDNLAYGNCTLAREHGHPREVYDCLIELHEMNWRRRELLRRRCPHTVLVSHSTRAFVLPVVCNFDALIYGEGYSFGSLTDYWSYFGFAHCLPAQGMIWPGGQDIERCPASLVYNYDLLTGGGQYSQIDWRLFPHKFPHAKGVTPPEPFYTQAYNLAQYDFGMYESRIWRFVDAADLFAATAPQTFATVYRNQTWGDWLIPVANMANQDVKTALAFHSPEALGFEPHKDYVLFNVHRRLARKLRGDALNAAFSDLAISGGSLQLFYLREAPGQAPFHLWGGKRISERWDASARKLTVSLDGPAGRQDTVFLAGANHGLQLVLAGGAPARFFFDPAQGLVHGQVTFTAKPLTLEAHYSVSGTNRLPHKVAAPASPYF